MGYNSACTKEVCNGGVACSLLKLAADKPRPLLQNSLACTVYKKAIWQFGKKGVLVNFVIQKIEVLHNCSASFCLSISRETKILGNERISFSKNPNLGVLFGGPLPPSEGGLLDVGDDGLGLPSRLGVDGAVLTSIGLFTTTD